MFDVEGTASLMRLPSLYTHATAWRQLGLVHHNKTVATTDNRGTRTDVMLSPGLGYSYSVLVLAVLEYWISGTHTLLVLVSSKVIVLVLVLVLVGKYSGTRMTTGTSTDILWFIWDVRVKTIIPETNSLTYHKWKVPNWFILLWFENMIHWMWLQIP